MSYSTSDRNTAFTKDARRIDCDEFSPHSSPGDLNPLQYFHETGKTSQTGIIGYFALQKKTGNSTGEIPALKPE